MRKFMFALAALALLMGAATTSFAAVPYRAAPGLGVSQVESLPCDGDDASVFLGLH